MSFAHVEFNDLVWAVFCCADGDEVTLLGVLPFAVVGLPIQIHFEDAARSREAANFNLGISFVVISVIRQYVIRTFNHRLSIGFPNLGIRKKNYTFVKLQVSYYPASI